MSFIHRTLNFRNLKQTREVPIQALVNRIFVTQHRSKARVTFAYVSFALIISSYLALERPVVIRVYNGLQGITKGIQGIARDSRGIQWFTMDYKANIRNYKGLQGSTRVYKGLQGIAAVYKRLQGIAGKCKGLQGSTGEYKGL